MYLQVRYSFSRGRHEVGGRSTGKVSTRKAVWRKFFGEAEKNSTGCTATKEAFRAKLDALSLTLRGLAGVLVSRNRIGIFSDTSL